MTGARPGGAPDRGMRRDALLLVVADVLVGVGNYAFSLVLVWTLTASTFSAVASVTSLLLVVGTAASAAVPWVMAREVMQTERGSTGRGDVLSFSVSVATATSLLTAVLVALVAVRFASPAMVALACAHVLFVFLGSIGVGYLQGEQRFAALAAVRIAEVVVRFAVGVSAALVWGTGAAAVSGIAAGSAVLCVLVAVAMRRDLRLVSWRRRARGAFWTQALGIGAIQGGVALLSSLDVLAFVVRNGESTGLAGYQALLVFARVPLFVGTALSVVAYPKLVGASGRPQLLAAVRESLLLYLVIAVAVAAVVATAPERLLGVVLPNAYGAEGRALLPPLALAGAAIGLVNLVTTYFQATSRFRPVLRLLAVGTLVSVAVLGAAATGDPVLLAWASAAVAGALALATVALLAWEHRSPGLLARLVPAGIGGVVAAAVLHLLAPHLVLWLVLSAALGAGCLLAFRRTGHTPARPRGYRADGDLRVLHLGFEDPDRPGAGGGSVRTHEVDRRLVAAGAEVTVACARHPGFVDHVRDGVRYLPFGWHLGRLGTGQLSSSLGYAAAVVTQLPGLVRRTEPDLVVEDFAAPFSTVGVPWLTRRPTVGVVQWLFARDKARQYHLPFHLVESFGLRAHRRLIAVSEDLADDLRARSPHLQVTTVRNGLEPAAFAPTDPGPGRDRSDLLYLGRLDIAQKGLDLLLDAYAAVADDLTGDLVLAGDGPDEQRLRDRAASLGIAGRVRWAGRVPWDDRLALLGSARAVVMPSRYETFGMVAAEALARATPVACFDIPCLRELVDQRVGRRVPAFDVPALSSALRELGTDAGLAARLGSRGPARVAHLTWDEAARRQLAVYREACAGTATRSRAEPSERPTEPNRSTRSDQTPTGTAPSHQPEGVPS